MTNHTLMIDVPTIEDFNDLYALLGIETLLLFAYLSADLAMLYFQDAEVFALMIGDESNLYYGYDQDTNPITYYPMQYDWAVSHCRYIVECTGFCVCLIPIN